MGASPIIDLSRAPRLDRAGGVWGVTLWSANRIPIFVAAPLGFVALGPLGGLVTEAWGALGLRFPEVTTDSLAVLPDRVRLLLHLAPGPRASLIARSMGWLKGTVTRAAAARGLYGAGSLWEAGFEGSRLDGALELALWRRRIEAGIAALTPGERGGASRSVGRRRGHRVAKRDLDLHPVLGDRHLGEDALGLGQQLGGVP